MFTPSLTTMMLHSIWMDIETLPFNTSFPRGREFVDLFDFWFNNRRHIEEMPEIPVIARIAYSRENLGPFKESTGWEEQPFDGGMLMSGRVRLDHLIRHYLDNYLVDESEIYDLGTSLIDAAATPGLSVRDQCVKWLQKTDQKSPRVHICIIDRGEKSSGGPDDFNGCLTHAETTNVEMSEHAIYVLYALLERLDGFGLLSDCKIYCSLVKPPRKPVGKKCFAHANSTEMVTALRKAQSMLATVSDPVLFNMSMGTHAGPHNGQSPLEARIRRLAPASSGRYFFASAGNDGLKGVANRVDLEADIQDTLLLQTGPAEREDLLLEFWWREPPHNGDVQFDVQLSLFDPGTKKFEPKFGTPLAITAGTASAALKTVSTHKAKDVLCASLFQKNCYSGMSCAALGLSMKPNTGGLPVMQLEITIRSIANPATVNSWVIVSDDPGTAFIAGNRTGSLTLPACDLAVVGVGGVHRPQSTLIPWSQASRGLASVYTDYSVWPPGQDRSQRAPWLAHRVELPVVNEMGTSFASPKACADAAGTLLKTHCATVEELVAALLTRPIPLVNGSWDERKGYGELG